MAHGSLASRIEPDPTAIRIGARPGGLSPKRTRRPVQTNSRHGAERTHGRRERTPESGANELEIGANELENPARTNSCAKRGDSDRPRSLCRKLNSHCELDTIHGNQ